jgi:hypothetical protein
MVKFQIIAVDVTLQQFIYHTSPSQNGEKLTTNIHTPSTEANPIKYNTTP